MMTTPRNAPGYEYYPPPEVANASDYIDGIESPDWTPSFTVDGAMTFDKERHGHAGVLTTHGILDVMSHVVEEGGDLIKAFLEGKMPIEEMPLWLQEALNLNAPPAVDVLADINPARHFRTTAYTIPAGLEPTLISAMGTRVRAVITNTGTANPAYLSWTDNVTTFNSAGDMEWITLNKGVDPTNPRIIQARGKIYAYSPLGTTIDIHEEYGLIDRRGVYNGPAGG
jgi:hypothetical protein